MQKILQNQARLEAAPDGAFTNSAAQMWHVLQNIFKHIETKATFEYSLRR